MMPSSKIELATLAGGCFWCLEAVYQELDGIERVVSGYSGGHLSNPSYRDVIAKTSGHAESVQLAYNPERIFYRDILHVFFTIHDPTTLNRQGNDVGPQYRSAIFFHDEHQMQVAEEVIASLQAEGLWSDPIVTEVQPFESFFEAEAYHQNYFRNNPYQGYCMVVIAPKVAKFRKKFIERLKKAPSAG